MCSIARFWPRRRPWHRSASGSTGCGETSRIPFLFCRAIFSMLWCRPRRCGPVVAVTVAFFLFPPFLRTNLRPGVRDENELGREMGMKTDRAAHMMKGCHKCLSSRKYGGNDQQRAKLRLFTTPMTQKMQMLPILLPVTATCRRVPGRRAKLLGNWLEKAVAKYKFPRDWGF